MQFDAIATLHERMQEFIDVHGCQPTVATLSPEAYSWMRTVSEEQKRVIGTTFFDSEAMLFDTGQFRMRIEIDELLEDYRIDIE